MPEHARYELTSVIRDAAVHTRRLSIAISLYISYLFRRQGPASCLKTRPAAAVANVANIEWVCKYETTGAATRYARYLVNGEVIVPRILQRGVAGMDIISLNPVN